MTRREGGKHAPGTSALTNLATMDLPLTGDRPGNGSVGLVMAGVVLAEMTRMGFSNRILRQFNRLRYIRQPVMNFLG